MVSNYSLNPIPEPQYFSEVTPRKLISLTNLPSVIRSRTLSRAADLLIFWSSNYLINKDQGTKALLAKNTTRKQTRDLSDISPQKSISITMRKTVTTDSNN